MGLRDWLRGDPPNPGELLVLVPKMQDRRPRELIGRNGMPMGMERAERRSSDPAGALPAGTFPEVAQVPRLHRPG
jgi:hypothetical protein